MDIHDYERKYQSAINRVKNGNFSARNKELIFKYHDALILENLSKPRLMKYLEILKIVAERLNKDLDQVNIDELKSFVAKIQQNNNYSPWTKQVYKVMIRRFYKWFYQTPDKEYPPIVKWIKINFGRSEKRLPNEGDLLTEADIQKLLNHAEHPRDKAFISVLWESGGRIGEIGTLCMKNVAFDSNGLIITVKGKTGPRKMRLISSTSYLSTWINMHPFKSDREAPLWINFGIKNHDSAMSYSNMKMLLINLFKKTGINKRCNPHLFRHSRATFMANHLTEFQMNQYFGWIQGSDMPSTYVHMSGREVDNAILLMNGIKNEEKKEEAVKPRICPRCDTINSFDAKHCNKCAGILDMKTAMEIEQNEKDRKSFDSMLDLFWQDKRAHELFREKAKEMGWTIPN